MFIGVTVIGFIRHGLHFLRFFVPEGVPKILLVLLVPIEVLSYFIRPFTLSIRLFANMLAGHTMLGIFAGFAALVGIFAIFPLAINVAAARSRITGRRAAGLRVRDPDLPLSERRDSHALSASRSPLHQHSSKRQEDKMDLAAAKMIGAGLACIALVGAGIGIGNVFASLISSLARNPAAQGQVQPFAFLGFALAEATGLFGLAIAFLILFVF